MHRCWWWKKKSVLNTQKYFFFFRLVSQGKCLLFVIIFSFHSFTKTLKSWEYKKKSYCLENGRAIKCTKPVDRWSNSEWVSFSEKKRMTKEHTHTHQLLLKTGSFDCGTERETELLVLLCAYFRFSNNLMARIHGMFKIWFPFAFTMSFFHSSSLLLHSSELQLYRLTYATF